MREIAYIAVEIGLCMQIDQISSCCWGKNEIKVNLCSSTPNERLSFVSKENPFDIRVLVDHSWSFATNSRNCSHLTEVRSNSSDINWLNVILALNVKSA